MTKSYGELESLLAVKKDQLMFLVQENEAYQQLISEEQRSQDSNRAELLKLKGYLQTLVATNEHLYAGLEHSCSQDREVQLMLSDKL
jgi:hypothetical protein